MNLPIQPIPISRSRQASPRPPSPQQTDPQLAQLDILGAFDPLAQDTKESNNLNGQGISSGNLAEAPIAEDDDFGGFVSVDSQGNSSSFSDFAISPTNGEGMLSLRRVSTSPTSQRRSSLSPTSPPRRLSSIMTSTSPPNPLSSTVQFSPSSPDTFRPTPPNEDFFASIEAQAPTTFKTSAFRFSPQPQTSPSNFFSATISKSLKNRWHGQNETKESRPAIPTFRPRKVSAPTLTTPTKEGEEEGWLSDQIQTASQTEVLDVPVPISPLRRATSHEILPEVRLLDRNIETEVIVTHNIVEQLRIHLPAQQRLAKSWRLLYSLDQHGISLHTMYKKVFDQGPLVMAVRDADDGVGTSNLIGPFLMFRSLARL